MDLVNGNHNYLFVALMMTDLLITTLW